jgi:hypothetical protein
MNDSIKHRQAHQPWTVPYSHGVEWAKSNCVPHILATHCTLHAAKSVGKLAAVFESLDHPLPKSHFRSGPLGPNDEQLETIKDMAADLFTAALRFANLYGFDLADVHQERVIEKNYPGARPSDIEGRSL